MIVVITIIIVIIIEIVIVIIVVIVIIIIIIAKRLGVRVRRDDLRGAREGGGRHREGLL